MTDHALLTVPKLADLSAHVDFHEGKRLVRFAGGKMYGGDAVRFMCNQWFGYEYLGTIRLRDGRTQ